MNKHVEPLPYVLCFCYKPLSVVSVSRLEAAQSKNLRRTTSKKAIEAREGGHPMATAEPLTIEQINW